MGTAQTEILNAPDQGNLRLSLVERLFVRLLKRLEGGALIIKFPGGGEVRVGESSATSVDLHILDRRFFRRVLRSGAVGFGESYVDGFWTTNNLSGLLALLAKNQRETGRLHRGFSWIAHKINHGYHLARENTVDRSRENIQEHYDLSNAFYETFLDSTMTYSSALFEGWEESLEEAQIRKIDRILDLADVSDGDHILEIGSGWGALSQRAAERGCRVKTITLSEEQFAYAKNAFKEKKVDSLVEIVLQDYRYLEGKFDAIVSCEMIEAVGHEYLESYFAKIRDSLKPGAKAVIQAITISDDRYESYRTRCDWIQKHIFPGGHLPSPGEIRRQILNAGDMKLVQSFSFGKDYGETLRRWAGRFNSSVKRVNALGFDAKFCRKWNYYLSYCEAGFDTGLIDVGHFVMQRNA